MQNSLQAQVWGECQVASLGLEEHDWNGIKAQIAVEILGKPDTHRQSGMGFCNLGNIGLPKFSGDEEGIPALGTGPNQTGAPVA